MSLVGQTQVLVAVSLFLLSSVLFCFMRTLFPYSQSPLNHLPKLFPSRRETPESKEREPPVVYGLLNTGNSCFINSVLQALSSLSSLPDFLDELLERKAREPIRLQKVELPVTEALLDTVLALNEPVPLSRHQSFRPTQIVHALASNRRVINHEQQDAQEFFQIVTSGIESEDALSAVGRGWWAGGKMGKAHSLFDVEKIREMLEERHGLDEEKSKIVDGKRILTTEHSRVDEGLAYSKKLFAGLQASRLSCMQCGYTAAIRHFTFNNLSLTLPRRPICTLESCLASFTSIEVLHDCVCRRCSLAATLTHTELELKRFRAPVQTKNVKSDDDPQMSEEDETQQEGVTFPREASKKTRALPVPYTLPVDMTGASTNNSSSLSSSKTIFPDREIVRGGSISSDDDEPLSNTNILNRPRSDSSSSLPAADITKDKAAPYTTINETESLPASSKILSDSAPVHSTSTSQKRNIRRRRKKNKSDLRSNVDGQPRHFTNSSLHLTSPHTVTSPAPDTPDGHLAKREAEKRAVEEAKRRVEEAMMGDVEREIEKEDGSEIGIDLVSVWRRVYLKVQSRCSTKQVMIAKAPQVLCLHLSRSTYTPYGVAMKNGCTVTFPEYLDLSPYMTTGTLSTRPDMPISSTQGVQSHVSQYYRLMAVIVHFGSHAFGHFVAYRRRGTLFTEEEEEEDDDEEKVEGISNDADPEYDDPGRKSLKGGFSGKEQLERDGRRRNGTFSNWNARDVNREDPYAWYRISDDQVEFVSIRQVLGANPYMLLYERAEHGEGEREKEREMKDEVDDDDEVEEDEDDEEKEEEEEEEDENVETDEIEERGPFPPGEAGKARQRTVRSMGR